MKQATARVTANWRRLYAMPVASVYPAYTAKAEKKGRTRAEVDEIFRWLTGHSQTSLEAELENKTSFEDFFAHAPKMNASRSLITGVVCGVRVEEIQEPRMREIRTSEDEILMLSQKQRLARSRSGTHQLDGELHPERQPADLSAGKLIRCGLPPLRPWIAADANPTESLRRSW